MGSHFPIVLTVISRFSIAPPSTAQAPAAQPTLRQRIAAMTGDQVASLGRLAGGLRKVTQQLIFKPKLKIFKEMWKI